MWSDVSANPSRLMGRNAAICSSLRSNCFEVDFISLFTSVLCLSCLRGYFRPSGVKCQNEGACSLEPPRGQIGGLSWCALSCVEFPINNPEGDRKYKFGYLYILESIHTDRILVIRSIKGKRCYICVSYWHISLLP